MSEQPAARRQADFDARNPDDPETFEAFKLSWGIDNDEEKKAMFELYRALIKLRKEHPVLKNLNKENINISANDEITVQEKSIVIFSK